MVKKVEVFDSKDSDDYDKFYKDIVGKNRAQIHAYWMKQIFTGRKKPPRKLSNRELQEELNRSSNSIGYTSQEIDSKKLEVTK